MDSTEDNVLPCHEKLAFDTRQQAAASAMVVAWQHGTKVRPYRCQYCDLWHLSSVTS